MLNLNIFFFPCKIIRNITKSSFWSSFWPLLYLSESPTSSLLVATFKLKVDHDWLLEYEEKSVTLKNLFLKIFELGLIMAGCSCCRGNIGLETENPGCDIFLSQDIRKRYLSLSRSISSTILVLTMCWERSKIDENMRWERLVKRICSTIWGTRKIEKE